MSRLFGKALLIFVLFFSLTNNIQGQITKTPDLDSICVGNSLDLTTGSFLAHVWTLTGGTPSSSTDQNPTVVYNTVGGPYSINVSLRFFIWEIANYTTSITVVSEPQAPTTYTRIPDSDNCRGDDYFVYVDPGTGGVGCSDELEYQTRSGGSWSGWSSYTNGQAIPSAGLQRIQVQARRVNCNASAGCTESAWSTVADFQVRNDNIPPVPDVDPLPDVTAECEVTSLVSPTATDNCGGPVTVTNDASLPISGEGTTTVVTWTYTDANNRSSTQTQNVIIDDVTAPVPDLATLPDVNGECEVTALTAPTATDNCVAAGSIIITNDATLPISGEGTTTVVTWTYDDGNGNTVHPDPERSN